MISNTSHHLFGSWDWENKPALPSPHHPHVLEDSWTSHSVSQPVWASPCHHTSHGHAVLPTSIPQANTHLKSCRAFLFFLRFSSSMGYSLNRSRPSRISPTGTADTSIFRVKFTSRGWEQPRVWYPAKLWAERHLQAKETEFVGDKPVPARRGLWSHSWIQTPHHLPPSPGEAETPGCGGTRLASLPPSSSAPTQKLTLS